MRIHTKNKILSKQELPCSPLPHHYCRESVVNITSHKP